MTDIFLLFSLLAKMFSIYDFCIDLGSSYVGVSQHFRYAFNRYAITYAKGRKAVSGYMERDFLIYSANNRNLF